MLSKKLVLKFPPRIVREPIVYHLVKDYDLRVNILRASISPDEAGHLVIDVEGTSEQIEGGCTYFEGVGVEWQLLTKDVHWLEDRCTACTACTSVCPTNALYVERPSMEVSFDSEKCIGCELCIPVCMYKAMQIQF